MNRSFSANKPGKDEQIEINLQMHSHTQIDKSVFMFNNEDKLGKFWISLVNGAANVSV